MASAMRRKRAVRHDEECLDWVPAAANSDPEILLNDLEQGVESGELDIADVERTISDFFTLH